YLRATINNHILEASLGYFINPLVNIGLGVIFLKERMTRPQIVALLIAAAGVAFLAIDAGRPPYVSLALAFSFGFYALLRKRAAVDAMNGLAIETTLLLPPALLYFAWLVSTGENSFFAGATQLTILLPLAGVVTVVPLLWFTEGARRLRMTTVGMLQYIAPTGQFLLAVAVYGEAFTRGHAVAFICIWTAIAIYSADMITRARRQRRKRREMLQSSAAPRSAAE
ncbi:MAG: EamA family transporter RarD, partial [Planctomycetota bacterium]|nr:EamA family transporter RarD [Planctomycetota bacterium]